MIITYTNKNGTVTFGGGDMDFAWRIKEIDGFGLVGKNYTASNYIGQPGQVTTSVSVNSRTITMSCDIKAGWDIQRVLSSDLVILDEDGVMTINVGYISRKIECRCIAATPGERDNTYQRYVFQFAADYPYFEDLEKTYIGVYQIQNLVDSNFTLPGILSKRTSRQIINTLGAAECEPIFIITVDEKADVSDNSGIFIKNHTTGQIIQLNYQPSAGEEITIDVPNRKIYNSYGTNLISKISDDTFLDGFVLLPGENDIEALNYNTNTTLTVICEFSNKYKEAVF